MFTLANEPQGIGRIIDNGFRLFAAGFKGAVGLLVLMILAMIGLVVAMTFLPMMMIDPATGSMTNVFVTIGIVYLLMMVIMTTFQNAMVAKYHAVAQGSSIGLGTSLGIGLRKVVPVILWYILFMIVLGVASIPAIIVGYLLPPEGGLGNLAAIFVAAIPVMILMITLMLGAYLIVMDDIGPITALITSHKLVWGRWWRTVLYLTIIMIIVLVIILAITIPLGIVGAMIAGDSPMLAASMNMIVNVFSLIMMPFTVALFLIYIYDLKVRSGGADIASRIAANT